MRTKKTRPTPNKTKAKNIHSALDTYYTNYLEELHQEKNGIHKKKHQLKKKEIEMNTTSDMHSVYVLRSEIR